MTTGESIWEYEGPISGGRGSVAKFDSGTYQLLAADSNAWTVSLAGNRLNGDFRIMRSTDEQNASSTMIAV